MARKWWLLTGLAALALAIPALAKETEPAPAAKAPTVSGVTVDAPKKDNPLVDPASEFVRQRLPQSQNSEQYPRFRDDICVKVVGLPDEYGAFIARRIVEIAAQAHAPMAKASDCKANVNVIFTSRPQALANDIARRKDILLGFYWNAANLKRLATFRRPVQAWYVTRVRDDTGKSWLEIHDPTSFLDPPHGRAGSRLSNGMSAEVVHSLIIADANKVAGEKIEAVADYVAVLALARWQRLDRCSSMPTILNLMADGCDPDAKPEAATPQDLALLTGLYSVQARESGSQQRATIASAIRKATAAEHQ
ncbi:hypothetical protein [Phenylobacterium sp.]|uniref:hypothetical protein n=1 Tax=Phenylobacterium sp. TaxID=1871053 RepID=UPI00120E4E26|nr:hypothetical protein [Phenylobacterium sp.]THD51662.1 MAG: hypothetical protein E8A12_20720 [Phenylobacterium sp.]